MSDKVSENQQVKTEGLTLVTSLDGAYDLQPQQDQLLLLESASAFMDNQAEPLEVRRILREFSGNVQLASKWRRYHLISAGIHHDYTPILLWIFSLASMLALLQRLYQHYRQLPNPVFF
jgi:hypothetical protein